MAATGGPIKEVYIYGRRFAVAQDADVSRSLGGFTKTLESNGDGTVREIMAREHWMVGGLTLNCDDGRDDQKYLQDIQDTPGMGDIAVVFASDETFAGVGTLVEKLEFSSQKSTVAVTLGGEHKLERQ